MRLAGFKKTIPGHTGVNPSYKKLNPSYSRNVRRKKKSNNPY